MDTRSSSGSGSHSANLNLNLDLNHDRLRASQHATYTTAGTVYNPQTAPPLQPPARRGRASRWPPANPTDLSAFNNSISGAFPRSRHRSPPTTASTLRHYSPLQQNQDRAIDPRHSANHHRPATSLSNSKRSTSGGSSNMSLSHSTALPRDLLADEPPKSIICNECREQFQTVAMADFHATLSGHDNFSEAGDDSNNLGRDNFLQDEESKEEEDLTQFNNYSVKTLTNLASYPNPNQKMAQRCLDRARETFKAAAENIRPMSPNSSQPGFNGIGASSSSYFSGSGRESSEYYSRVSRNAHMNSSTRSSVLSNGPGAPQPLTAGPPGQRHYKASTLEGPLRALHESAQNPYSLTMDESLFGPNPPNPSALSVLGRPPSSKMPEASSFTERDIKQFRSLRGPDSPHPVDASTFEIAHRASGTAYRESRYNGPTVLHNQKNRWTNGMCETKAQDEVRGYYRVSQEGIPSDYNPAAFVSVPDNDSDLQPLLRRVPLSRLEPQIQGDIDLALHRKRFYAADFQMFRSWEYRFDEIRDKARDAELGLVDDCRRLTLAQIEAIVDPPQLGKPRNISVSLINQLQPQDAGRALLPLLYSTLANLKNDFSGSQKPQKPEGEDRWAFPRPGYVGLERKETKGAQMNRFSPQSSSWEENPRW